MLNAQQPAESAQPVAYVVEDDPGARDALVAIVETQGYRCETFESAEGFLAIGPPARPACLVIDFHLRGLSDTTRLDRGAGAFDALPIVVTTGHADLPAAVRFLERGAVALIEKPFQPARLLAAIERAIGQDSTSQNVRQRFERIGRSVNRLTERERVVLRAIVDGQLNKAIARSLDVSVRTIEGDRAKIVEKFGAETTGEVVGKYAQYTLMTELGYRFDAAEPAFRPPVSGPTRLQTENAL